MNRTEWLKYWGQLFLLPLYACSKLVPRRTELWLFGSTLGGRFADNPRYFFQYCSQYANSFVGKKRIRPIWISHNKELVNYLKKHGYEAYFYHSWKGLYYALVGKVYLYDHYSKDINFWQSGGAVKVNLWHGIPLKKIQADNRYDRFRHPNNLWERWKCFPRNLSSEQPTDYHLTTSKKLIPIFASAFRSPNVFTCGAYPRTDYLISKEIRNLLLPKEREELEAIKTVQKQYKNQGFDTKVIFYMPTFRESETKFFEVMNLERFQTFLEQEHLLFCMKLHPFSKLREVFLEKVSGKFQNFLLLDTDSDPYVFLKRTDVLVTDYSSVFFDFLLLDRPVIFFDYDREEYLTQSRELYYDYEEMTPGEKVETMEALLFALKAACYPSEEYQKNYAIRRKQVREQMFDTPEELASPKLLEKVVAFVNSSIINKKG